MISIRRAELNDFEKVYNLILQVHKLHVKNRKDIYKDVDPLNKKIFEEELNNVCLVAEKDDEIVGVCMANEKDFQNSYLMKGRKILNISEICVDEEMQRQGIGTMLYNEVVNYAKCNNFDSVELMVWGFNKEAIEFYKNIGMDIKNIKFEKKIK